MRSISIVNRHPRLRVNRRRLLHALHTLDAHFPPSPPRSSRPAGSVVPPGELTFVFLTDAALARLHADFLQDPSPTDVITFPGDPGLGLAGEVCISVDAAVRHCQATKVKAGGAAMAKCVSTELTLYVVHGWLHLAGYDDLVPAKKRAMRRAEVRALALLRAHRALADFDLKPGT